MDKKIEEVKKNRKLLPQVVGKGGEANDEPKPDSSTRLLAPEEISVYKLYGTEIGKVYYDIDGLLKAQRDLTASIKDTYWNEVVRIAVLSREAIVTQIKEAECQAKIERIKKEMELWVNDTQKNSGRWRGFWEQEGEK